ncbi:hypothetical protein V6Z05_10490 [Leptospira venezuelensis]|uniref:hypothetical protein n=1 Tax=Leptospira venezuelensis TaxID=1958811 RepID=UPI000A3A329B|nr:hypothetical protein [Leptospira venezuelensis]
MNRKENQEKAIELYYYIDGRINEFSSIYRDKKFFQRDLMVLSRIKSGIFEKDIKSLVWLKNESKGIADTLGSYVEDPNFLNDIYKLLSFLGNILEEEQAYE